MKSQFLIKTLAPPLIAALIPAVFGYMKVLEEEKRGWDRYEIMRNWAEEPCEDDEQTVSGQQQE